MTGKTVVPTANVAAIAAGLTKAQREALVRAEVRGRNYDRSDRYVCPNAGRVRAALFEKGLAFPAIPMIARRSDRREVALTPLGHAIRQHLIEKAKA